MRVLFNGIEIDTCPVQESTENAESSFPLTKDKSTASPVLTLMRVIVVTTVETGVFSTTAIPIE